MRITGSIKCVCDNCGHENIIDVGEIEMENVEADNRSMGWETRHSGTTISECEKCKHEHSLEIDVWEYPVNVHNATQVFTYGCTSVNESLDYSFDEDNANEIP